MGKTIGIDLGTTNSCVSVMEGKEAVIIPNPEGARVIPTMVAVGRDGKRIYGNVAKRQLAGGGVTPIWGIKRLIGRKFESDEVREIHKRTSFSIVAADNGDVKVQLGERFHSPEEISGMFLTYLKSIAETYLGEPVSEAVITVPAFFNDAQRQATKVAGEIAGLSVARIVNEPTAALLAYGEKITRGGIYAVYDLGGGTFDISIVEVRDDVYKVVSSLGDTFLGGSDFDARICDWILAETQRETGVDLSENREIVQRMMQVAEKAKIELSFNQETLVAIPYLHHFADGTNYHFQRKFTRAQLEAACGDLVGRTITLIGQALEDIGVAPGDVERVVLVGGQSRMPMVGERLAVFFGRPPAIDINPEEVVAQGAAIQSEILRGRVRDLLLLDVTPLSIGVETKGDVFTRIIERNATIPIKKSMVFTTIADNQTTVKIHVLQGEREIASANKSLGFFDLVGVPLAPRGIPQIEVSFEIDANGIAVVSAVDKQTGLSQSMRIQPSSGLSPQEIERILHESEHFEEEDRKKVRINQLRLLLREECNSVQSCYNRYVEKLSEAEREDSDALLARAERTLLEGDVPLLETVLVKVQNLRGRINQILLAEFAK